MEEAMAENPLPIFLDRLVLRLLDEIPRLSRKPLEVGDPLGILLMVLVIYTFDIRTYLFLFFMLWMDMWFVLERKSFSSIW